ncbi:MAG: MBL fold metallo-hydrolase, partial [Verrucomicrobiota bacterium]|nr:MBL fold metallo-hydrolase [Verrucomicrobiota bacterium]
MKSAYKKNQELLSEIQNADESPEKFHLWWLGQSGFLIKWRQDYLLLDPYLSDSLTDKYSKTDKPHTRITEQTVNPKELDFVSIATSSHNHTDHLDSLTLLAINESRPGLRLILPKANIQFASERLGSDSGIELIGIKENESISIGNFTINGIAASHNEIERNEEGSPIYMGFIIHFGDWTIYHSGDTLWHEHLTASLINHSVDVAIVPINGNDPSRRVAGNLNGTEAAALSKAINAQIAIPHHFDMFEFNTASPDEFTEACEKLDQPFCVLQNGQGWCS